MTLELSLGRINLAVFLVAACGRSFHPGKISKASICVYIWSMFVKSFCRSHCVALIALVLVVLPGVLYVGNGVHIPVIPHDQLDDQVICYMESAKHLGESYYIEFMGGQSSSALVTNVPGMQLFYFLLPPVTAFACNLLFVMTVSFISLYVFLQLLGVRDSAGALVSLAFSYLPFYSVYGLSSMGVPLILVALFLVAERDKLLLPVLLCIVYTFFSSLVWIGFAVCFMLSICAFHYAFRRMWRVFRGVGLLLIITIGTYIVFNLDMLSSILLSGVEGHRSEFALNPEEASLYAIWDFFLQGYYHSVSNHFFLAVVDIAAFGGGCIWVLRNLRNERASAPVKRLLKYIGLGLMTALFIAVFKVAYHSSLAIELRYLLPDSLRSFQLDRFYWLYPSIWYVTTGLAFEMLLRIGSLQKNVFFAWAAILVSIAMTLGTSLQNNVVLENANSMLSNRSSSLITWEQFYSEDLFDQIKEDIGKTSDGALERVVSVGIHPAVALYNGLSTLDGYSTNYPLTYKHDFSRLIEGELAKSDTIKSYFWDWGNRCYVFSHELGLNFLIPRDSGIVLRDFSLNVDVLKEMGAGYVISAVPITNCNQIGLTEIGCYRTEQSYYELWLYKVK